MSCQQKWKSECKQNISIMKNMLATARLTYNRRTKDHGTGEAEGDGVIMSQYTGVQSLNQAEYVFCQERHLAE